MHQWRSKRPHAYLSRDGSAAAGDGDGGDAGIPALRPLHLACLMHDLPPPPTQRTRGEGVESVVKGGVSAVYVCDVVVCVVGCVMFDV